MLEERGYGKDVFDIFNSGFEMIFLFSIQKLYVIVSKTMDWGINWNKNKAEYNIYWNINGNWIIKVQKLIIQSLYLLLTYRWGTFTILVRDIYLGIGEVYILTIWWGIYIYWTGVEVLIKNGTWLLTKIEWFRYNI